MELWERQPREPRQAFAKFCAYRDLGPNRSLAKTAKALGDASVTVRQLETLSARWRWVARAEAWDAMVDAERRRANVQEIVEMDKRQAALASGFQAKLIESLQNTNWANVSVAEQARMLDVASRLERLARGADTVRHGGKIEVEKAKLTPAERRAAMIAELKRLGHTEESAKETLEAMLGNGAA